MNLLAPWFLAGLGALAVPVLVHLIQKERKDAVPFPSLMFLEQAPYQSVRRQQIRHWPLLLLRCLALALLALAFARPFLASHGDTRAGGLAAGGRDIIVALDRSYSMGYGDRWARATSAARDVVARMGVSDRAAVVYFAGEASLVGELTQDGAALRTAIDSVRPTAGVTRYAPLLRRVRDVFGDTAQPRREVVLISDYQRTGWGAHELPTLPPGTTLTRVDVGSAGGANVLVAGADVRYDTSAGHERVIVVARVANRGPTPVAGASVSLELNGRSVQTRPVNVPAGGAADVVFTPVATPPGESRATVRTGPDALAPDNAYNFVVARQPSLSVLLVQSPDAGVSAGPFIARALGIGGRVAFRVRTVRPEQLSAEALRGAALVVLNGTSAPDAQLGRRLTEYVENGGGLFVVLGGHGADAWPKSADGLLPRAGASLVDRRDDRGATLEFIDRGHAVFEPFGASRTGDFSTARFSRYWRLRPAADDRQLARFDDGGVALLERRVGAGRVLVWSSDLSGAWNDLPLQPVFLPFLHQAAKYAAGYEEERRAMTVSEALNLPALFGESTRPDRGRAQQAAVAAQYVAIAPSGTQMRFSTNTSESPASLELTEQGFYDVRRTGGAGDSARAVAVNVDLSESDLAPLDTAAFARAVAPRAENRERPVAAAADLTAGELERRQRVWWYLLVAALVLLGAETLLSNRLSRGGALIRSATRGGLNG